MKNVEENGKKGKMKKKTENSGKRKKRLKL